MRAMRGVIFEDNWLWQAIWSVNFLQIACFDSHLKCFFWKGPYEVEIWSEKRQFWHSLKIVNQASNWHVDYYIHVLVVVTSKNFENDQFYGSSEASFLENSPFRKYCEMLIFLKMTNFRSHLKSWLWGWSIQKAM